MSLQSPHRCKFADVKCTLHEELNPVYEDLENLRSSVESVGKNLNSELDSLHKSLDNVRQELTSVTDLLDTKINDLVLENRTLKRNQAQSETQISKLTYRIVSLETHMRRDNLKFLNVKYPDRNVREDCETNVLALCKDMHIELDSRDIVRAHRTGPKRDNSQPIIVKFAHFKDKLRVLRAKRNFRAIGILVVEDFPQEVLEHRKQFIPVLKTVHNSGGKCKARLVVDKLLLNDKLYTTQDILRLPEDLRPQNTSTITKNNITAFFTKASLLSNHFPSKITVDNHHYSTVEPFFMNNKALHFNDADTSSKILASSDPKHCKSLGRKVNNFDLASWREVSSGFMKMALLAKFQQHRDLVKYLKDTGDHKLVEANPHDKYWGGACNS